MRALLVLAGSVAACAGPPRSAPAPRPVASAPPQAAPPPPPDDAEGRLPPLAVPQAYDVNLLIDPAKEAFAGSVKIQVLVAQPTFCLVLHARDLLLPHARAVVGTRVLMATTTARVAHDASSAEELVLTFAEPLPAGPVRIEIEYQAPFGRELAGLYRVEEGGHFYVFSQFEATDARRAIPCFDEPSYKAPFTVALTVPRGMIALGNMPEVAAEDAGTDMVTHRLAPTPPLPTYLLAFAVGDLEFAEGRKSPVPIRVVTTKGHAGLAGTALEAADALVTHLGGYFDLPYPFAKLDLVAVPDFAAGAMENPGLLMFRDVLLLQDPAHVTTGLRRAQAVTIAHELAHQWFGDLVTMQWWNDLWLNEGFATWAQAKAVDAWKPSFGATMEQVAFVGHVMDTDALASARAVREPVRSTGDAKEAFDGLTYDKGAAVLRMIEGWLGPDTFRRGVQRYLKSNAWKSARAEDLFQALDYVSSQKVDEFAAGFLDRPGVPEVTARLVCSAGKSTLELRQSQWRPLGEPGGPPSAWTLPVCTATDARKARACFTLGAEPIARELGPGCPAWVFPNSDQAGYYRFVLDRTQLIALARAARSMDPVARLGIVSNGWAAVRAGAIEPSTLLDVLPLLDGEDNRLVLSEIVAVLRGIDDALVDEVSRGAFRRYVAARFGPAKRALGWETRAAPRGAHEDDEKIMRRQIVLSAMGEIAQDDATLAEADAYARKWMEDPSSIPGDVAAVAVPLASIRQGPRRLEELRDAVRRATAPQDRALALRAMGAFDDPQVLAQAFDVALGADVKLSEMRHVFGAAVDHRAARPALYAWEKSHWDKLKERLPGTFGRGPFLGVAGTLCSPREREDARAFLTEATRGLDGLRRPLDEALEASGLCIALREHGADDVARYFARGGAGLRATLR